ncbi:thiol reductant ABC exporter subunit CydD [Actinomyces sp. 2119]|uniref:thiol reductant ABC exporter subunit CydD n=1 Tax=Actinomyces sp. 2119 TaxID=2321393 RepID=UPI000E6D3727|nr:thiol reductant ABC exporter subunit CydD [Actinomyces sp. 2119]RJF42516.1 thiol reductant ABC exporter subunit CydD [Actinomyces sp. 2119]
MKPLDPRLLRHARAARRYIATTTLSGGVVAGLVIAQAVLVSQAVAPAVVGSGSARSVPALVLALGLVVVARPLVLYLQESLAHRAATRTVIDLRRQVLQHAVALGPRWLALHGSDTATLLTRALEDLEPYFVRYLPQLLLAATVTPATTVVLLTQDLPSTVVVICTIPLIPVFMILIGRMTQAYSQERLEAMERLGGQVLDLLAGLPTLKALGREKGPAARVRALGRAYNRTTMSTLRVAFLSGAVLEFITTLSVAIVAVQVGFRLLYGNLDLSTGLLVLMIAPEVYQPIRQVGFQFHASANGVAAAEAVFEVLETPLRPRGQQPCPDLATSTVSIERLCVSARGRWAPDNLSAQIRPGRLVVLTGASGAGKTTTTQVLLGLLPADKGEITVLPQGDASRAVRLEDIDPATWWRQVSWVPQRPVIVPGTVLDNVLRDTGLHDTTSLSQSPPEGTASLDSVPAALVEAARTTGLDEVVSTLPQGWSTLLGQGGVGLSVGQRQRLALTRALLAPTALVVMDEPTAHLDAASEAHVLDGVRALHASGRTVVVIAHRPALASLAQDTVTITSSTPSTADSSTGPEEAHSPGQEAP